MRASVAWALLGMGLLGVSSAGAVLLTMGGVPPIHKAAWRLQATTLILVPFAVTERRRTSPEEHALRGRELPLLISGTFLATHFGLWIASLDMTSLTHSLLFVTSHPFLILFGMLILRQPAGSKAIAGVIAGGIGAVMTTGDLTSAGGATLLGDLVALAGAAAIVGYLAIGRSLRQDMALFAYALPVTGIAAAQLSLAALLLEPAAPVGVFGWIGPSHLLAVAYLAFGPGLLGHTAINGAMRHIQPLVISVALTFEPIIGSIIGWTMGVADLPGSWTVMGGALMITGTILVILDLEQSSPVDEPS
ncbi:MAG TPA: DMT family transporter [Candidatus Poseidoniales archaeon]|nr:DMT family transporter [Candidatus Poseidoniales archaeon]